MTLLQNVRYGELPAPHPIPPPLSALYFVDKHPDQGAPGGFIHIRTVASLLIALLPQEIHSTFRQGNNSVVFIEIYIW